MRTSRFLLFILLALFYANTVSAIIVGNQFTRDGITYEVTYMDIAHDGHPVNPAKRNVLLLQNEM